MHSHDYPLTCWKMKPADEKTATFLVEDARIVLSEYGGDLNRLRELSNRNPAQVAMIECIINLEET